VPLRGTRTYVGFGFGPIQAGLFLYEAFVSGNFRRLVVAEVLPDVVAAVRRSQGCYCLNIAHPDRVEQAQVGPLEIEDPAKATDRERLVNAVAEAEEIGTAVPSVQHYVSGDPGSIHRILAEGLRRKAARGGPRAVIYTAENHNQAARILEASVLERVPEAERDPVRASVRFLNTAVAKMSGMVSDPEEITAWGLTTMTTGLRKAFLVEAFNRILISKIRFEAPFHRGIEVFEEKPDLLPFEEAKLYGHNAVHALAAYMGMTAGVKYVADLQEVPGVIDFLRDALIEESGTALRRRYAHVDALFTPEGYRHYADDLLTRMVNPYLRDTVQRVGRDPERKLGWDDRLTGTVRMALREGVEPRRYGFGAAAALAQIAPSISEGAPPVPAGDPSILEGDSSPASLLRSLWHDTERDAQEERAVLRCIEDGLRWLARWSASGLDRSVLEGQDP
jgi:mannitol-1-phosphate 5-dehydrogenase